MADKTNGDKNINTTFLAIWSKFHKTDNTEDIKIVLLEVSSLWNFKEIAATTRELLQLYFTKILAAIR